MDKVETPRTSADGKGEVMGDEADAMWDSEMIDEGYEAVAEMAREEQQRMRSLRRRKRNARTIKRATQKDAQ